MDSCVYDVVSNAVNETEETALDKAETKRIYLWRQVRNFISFVRISPVLVCLFLRINGKR